MSSQPLTKSQAKLVAFGGQRIRSLGKSNILCEYKGKYYPIEFEVVSNVSNVLGLKTITELKLVKRKGVDNGGARGAVAPPDFSS